MSLLKMRDKRPVNSRSERVGLFVVDYESNYEILFYFFPFPRVAEAGKGRNEGEVSPPYMSGPTHAAGR